MNSNISIVDFVMNTSYLIYTQNLTKESLRDSVMYIYNSGKTGNTQ